MFSLMNQYGGADLTAAGEPEGEGTEENKPAGSDTVNDNTTTDTGAHSEGEGEGDLTEQDTELLKSMAEDLKLSYISTKMCGASELRLLVDVCSMHPLDRPDSDVEKIHSWVTQWEREYSGTFFSRLGETGDMALKAIRHATLRTFRANTTLWNQGDAADDTFYWILSGSVDLTRFNGTVKNINSGHGLGVGSSFGEKAFTVDHGVDDDNDDLELVERAAGVRTKTDAIFLTVTRIDFLTLTGHLTAEVAKVLATRSRNPFQLRLLERYFERIMDSGEDNLSFMKRVSRAATYKKLRPQEELFKQGDPAEAFYMIVSGYVQVIINGNPIGCLGPGEAFGEAGLNLNDLDAPAAGFRTAGITGGYQVGLPGAPSAEQVEEMEKKEQQTGGAKDRKKANAKRNEKLKQLQSKKAKRHGRSWSTTELAVISKKGFEKLITGTQARVKETLSSSSGTRSADDVDLLTDLLHGTTFFDVIASPVLQKQCCRALRLREGETGEYLFNHGDQADLFYIVIEGEVREERQDGHTRLLKKRECFGEREFLQQDADQQLRSSAMVCTQKSFFATLTRGDYMRLVGSLPDEAMQVLCKRVDKRTALDTDIVLSFFGQTEFFEDLYFPYLQMLTVEHLKLNGLRHPDALFEQGENTGGVLNFLLVGRLQPTVDGKAAEPYDPVKVFWDADLGDSEADRQRTSGGEAAASGWNGHPLSQGLSRKGHSHQEGNFRCSMSIHAMERNRHHESSTTVSVKGFPRAWRGADLYDVFRRYGDIHSTRVEDDIARVSFAKTSSAQEASRDMIMVSEKEGSKKTKLEVKYLLEEAKSGSTLKSHEVRYLALKDKVVVAQLLKADFGKIVVGALKELTAILKSVPQNRTLRQLSLLATFFKETSMLKAVRHSQILGRNLCRFMGCQQFRAGERLFRRGLVGDRVYIVLKGAVLLRKTILESSAVGDLAPTVCQRGAELGTEILSSTEDKRYEMVCTAATDLILAVVLKEDFNRIVNLQPLQVAINKLWQLGIDNNGNTEGEGEAKDEEKHAQETAPKILSRTRSKTTSSYDAEGRLQVILGPDGLPIKQVDMDGNLVDQYDLKGNLITEYSTRQAKAEAQEGSHKLHVRGVGGRFEDEGHLRELFGQYGHVLQATVHHREDEDGNNTSWALVTMQNEKSVEKVLAARPIMNLETKVEFTINKFCKKQAAESRGGMSILNFHGYKAVYTRIVKTIAENHLSTKADQAQALQDDWANDLELYGDPGAVDLTHAQYTNALYQLVDEWCGGVEYTAMYVHMLEMIVDNSTVKDKHGKRVEKYGTGAKQTKVTAWIGGMPAALAEDEAALHKLLAAFGELEKTTTRIKSAPYKSWCLATFHNLDAMERLMQGPIYTPSPEPGHTPGSPPPQLLVREADVKGELAKHKAVNSSGQLATRATEHKLSLAKLKKVKTRYQQLMDARAQFQKQQQQELANTKIGTSKLGVQPQDDEDQWDDLIRPWKGDISFVAQNNDHDGSNRKYWKKMFDSVDDDGSEELDVNELKILCDKLGRELNDEELELAMSEMNEDGGGAVSFEEFYTWFKKVTEGDALLLEVFESVDMDGTGSLDRDEVRQVLIQLGRTPSEFQLNKAMEEMDESGDNEVNFDEFRAWYNVWSAQQQLLERKAVFHGLGEFNLAKAMEMFEKIDVDGSGELDNVELSQLCQYLGRDLSEAELESAMLEMDTNGGGTISFDEFAAWFRALSDGDLLLREVFALVDIDGSGLLDQDQVHDVLDRLGLDISEEELDVIVQQIDEDESGEVEYDEIAQWFNQYRAWLKRLAAFQRLTNINHGEAKRLFDAADKDSSGEIDRKELAGLCKLMDRNLNEKELDAAMREMDTDGGGTVGFEEFQNWFMLMAKGDKLLREAFDAVDIDGGGVLDRAEVSEVMITLGMTVTEESVDKVMNRMDKDGSGEVTFEEFQSWFNWYRAEQANLVSSKAEQRQGVANICSKIAARNRTITEMHTVSSQAQSAEKPSLVWTAEKLKSLVSVFKEGIEEPKDKTQGKGIRWKRALARRLREKREEDAKASGIMSAPSRWSTKLASVLFLREAGSGVSLGGGNEADVALEQGDQTKVRQHHHRTANTVNDTKQEHAQGPSSLPVAGDRTKHETDVSKQLKLNGAPDKMEKRGKDYKIEDVKQANAKARREQIENERQDKLQELQKLQAARRETQRQEQIEREREKRRLKQEECARRLAARQLIKKEPELKQCDCASCQLGVPCAVQRGRIRLAGERPPEPFPELSAHLEAMPGYKVIYNVIKIQSFWRRLYSLHHVIQFRAGSLFSALSRHSSSRVSTRLGVNCQQLSQLMNKCNRELTQQECDWAIEWCANKGFMLFEQFRDWSMWLWRSDKAVADAFTAELRAFPVHADGSADSIHAAQQQLAAVEKDHPWAISLHILRSLIVPLEVLPGTVNRLAAAVGVTALDADTDEARLLRMQMRELVDDFTAQESGELKAVQAWWAVQILPRLKKLPEKLSFQQRWAFATPHVMSILQSLSAETSGAQESRSPKQRKRAKSKHVSASSAKHRDKSKRRTRVSSRDEQHPQYQPYLQQEGEDAEDKAAAAAAALLSSSLRRDSLSPAAAYDGQHQTADIAHALLAETGRGGRENEKRFATLAEWRLHNASSKANATTIDENSFKLQLAEANASSSPATLAATNPAFVAVNPSATAPAGSVMKVAWCLQQMLEQQRVLEMKMPARKTLKEQKELLRMHVSQGELIARFVQIIEGGGRRRGKKTRKARYGVKAEHSKEDDEDFQSDLAQNGMPTLLNLSKSSPALLPSLKAIKSQGERKKSKKRPKKKTKLPDLPSHMPSHRR